MTLVSKRNRFVTIVRESPPGDFEERAVVTDRIWEGWARLRPASGKEIEVANAMQSSVTHVVELDFPFVSIKPQDIIKYEKAINAPIRTLNIVSVRNLDESDRELHLMCIEVVTDG